MQAQESMTRARKENPPRAQDLADHPGGGEHEKPRNNPMQSRLAMLSSPRCGARTRCGEACCAPAMPNGRCRMHGGRSPGAPKGNQHAFKHGRYGAEAIARRRYIGRLLRNMRVLTAALDGRVGGGSAKSAEQPHAKDEAAARQRPAPNSAEQPHAKGVVAARRGSAPNSVEQPHAKGEATARQRPAPKSAKQPHAKAVAEMARPRPGTVFTKSAKQPHAKAAAPRSLAGIARPRWLNVSSAERYDVPHESG